MNLRTAALLATILLSGAAPPRLPLVTDEAESALAILDLLEAGRPVPDAAWQRLFRSEGYRRLQTRERSMGRSFDDADFRAFLLSDTLRARAPALRRTLSQWRAADLGSAAAKASAYLPAGTALRARVYLLIKPKTNSFVFEPDADPAIMLYLDPSRTPAQLENTVAHELHHIGYAAACAEPEDSLASEAQRTARTWLGAFGEGVAMLAAAGGSEVHPHAASLAEDRARWDRDVANAPADLDRLQRFLLDVLQGRLADPDSVRAAGMEFFGVQGPWYTVGWLMASTVETAVGRDSLVAALCDPPVLLRRYNEAARKKNAGGGALPLWSGELLAALGGAG